MDNLIKKRLTDNLKKVMKKRGEEKAAKAHKELKEIAFDLDNSNYLDYLYFITNQINDDDCRRKIKKHIQKVEEEIKEIILNPTQMKKLSIQTAEYIKSFRNDLNNFIKKLEDQKVKKDNEEKEARVKYDEEELKEELKGN